jgi:hypothetical protein
VADLYPVSGEEPPRFAELLHAFGAGDGDDITAVRTSPITRTKNGPGDWSVDCSLCGWHTSAPMSQGEAAEDGDQHMAEKHPDHSTIGGEGDSGG